MPRAWLRRRRQSVLMVLGFSAQGYADTGALQQALLAAIQGLDRRRWLIAAGATPEGIGAVYPLAKSLGFGTLGIVSSRVLGSAGSGPAGGPHHPSEATESPWSSSCDTAFVIDDASWGGLRPGGHGLAPTSKAVVDVADRLLLIGGGGIARVEACAARRAGKPVQELAARPAAG